VPCRPTSRPGSRDEYSACCAVELTEGDLFDFLLFSLPDNDHYSHRHGPEATVESIAKADRCFAQLVRAAGGLDGFLTDHALVLLADHAQTPVHRALPLAEALGERWRVLLPNDEEPHEAQLAVSPTARAANIYLVDAPGAPSHAELRAAVAELEGVDLFAWLADADGEPIERHGAGTPRAGEASAVVERGGERLRFRPGQAIQDLRGGGWEVEGDLAVLEAEIEGGKLRSTEYPDPLARLWSALAAPHAGDLVLSLSLGYECVDWGGASHVGGGSHGSLHRGDSLGPLLFVGCGPADPDEREQWSLRDVAGVILDHFGVAADRPVALNASIGSSA
jgi:hypothetical protein